MSRSIGKNLPKDLHARLSPESARSVGPVVLMLTSDGEGWPHVAMLSLYELVAAASNVLLLATHSSSKSCANLETRKKVTIAFVDEQMTYYVKGEAKHLSLEEDIGMTAFRVEINDILEDKMPGARITSGLTFHEDQPGERHESVLERLAELSRRAT